MKRLILALLTTLSMIHGVGAAEPEPMVSRAASRTVQAASAEHFTGRVKVDLLFAPGGADRASGGSVTFAPGTRTHWHTHPLGQTLIVTGGVGRVQLEGDRVVEVKPGDVVRIPADTRHWHGAAPDSALTHIAVQEAVGGRTVEWLEAVSDEQCNSRPVGPAEAPSPASSVARQVMGDIAPKLVQLTDDVLFGDVWARPGLSPRDRSLITISALIALNRSEQLRSHMALGMRNGLTESEIVETLTHLAFYARVAQRGVGSRRGTRGFRQAALEPSRASKRVLGVVDEGTPPPPSVSSTGCVRDAGNKMRTAAPVGASTPSKESRCRPSL